MEDEFIKKLREKYENGEISKETYEDILQRYLEEKGKDEAAEDLSEDKVAKKIDYAMKKMEKSLEKIDIESTTSTSGRDYRCAGSCTLGPGTYGIISSAGSLKITGDIRADKITSAGSLFSDGNIHTDIFRSAGSAKINGNILGDDISAARYIQVIDMQGDRIKIGGMIVCNALKGDRIALEGGIKAEEVMGDEITIKIDGKGEVKRIEGDEINIRSRRGFFRRCSGKLKVGNIKGDNIYLECVIAENVEGEEVVVGENCEIGTLKAEKMKISKNSKVRKVVRK